MGVMPKRLNSGSGYHRLEFVGLPMAVTRQRTTALASLSCCVLSPVPFMTHLIPSMSPMSSLVSY